MSAPIQGPNEQFQDALTRLGGDIELMKTMAAIVVEDGPILQRQMVDAASADDWVSTADASHSLRGLLATFQLGGAVSKLEQLERLARQGDGPAVKSMLGECVADVKSLIRQVSLV